MRICVTGGTGFIGSHLVRALVDRGDEAVVISRSGRDPWGHPQVQVVQADPASPGDWQRHAGQADGVVNL
ncbi:MAG: NAD-dependent epimerase/dehydratase family protein, partial [Gemmatimonadales bacterium]